jgi:hypothetical protein
VACCLPLVQRLAARHCPYEALASAGIPPREATRRGAGWLPGVAESGWSQRLGWDAGFPLLLAVTPVGGIPGCGFGAASPQDQPRADTCFALRRWPPPGWPSVGAPALGPDVVDTGCEGQEKQVRWGQTSGAQVLCPPKRTSQTPWPQSRRRGRAGMRQSVETVSDTLCHPWRLDRERPHELSGFWARLAAKIALQNFCIGLNEQLGRPRLAFADLVHW